MPIRKPNRATHSQAGRTKPHQDLGLPRDAPVLAETAQAYLAAARQEFWQEAARPARRRLEVSGSRDADEGGDRRQDIADPATGLSRLLSERCSAFGVIVPLDQTAYDRAIQAATQPPARLMLARMANAPELRSALTGIRREKTTPTTTERDKNSTKHNGSLDRSSSG